MVDWKKYLGEGPWPFQKQRNKWGYLNNPRWVNPGAAPINYDGNESAEPQVWTLPNQSIAQLRGTQNTHNPCGHWHQPVSIVTPPEPPEPSTLLPWYSCPEGIIPVPTGDVWYITTDDDDPTDTFYVLKYSGGVWSAVYSLGLDISEDSSYAWIEPDVAVAWSGATRVVVLIRVDPNYFAYALDIFTFNGETLAYNTLISGDFGFDYGKIVINLFQSVWAFIDNLGYIHVIAHTYVPGPTYSLRDFISTDGGQTFNDVLISSTGAFDTHEIFIKQLSNGTIYVTKGASLYYSTNNGTSWSTVAGGMGKSFSYFEALNDIFFGVVEDSPDVKLYKSTNGTAWTLVATVANLSTYFAGAALAYDGTYYYMSLLFRNSAIANSDGYSQIYRSSDGDIWTLLTTINDECNLGIPTGYAIWPAQIVVSDGVLYYFFYYGELESDLPGEENVFYKTIWKSIDQGETWTSISTPFYDLSKPGQVAPPGA